MVITLLGSTTALGQAGPGPATKAFASIKEAQNKFKGTIDVLVRSLLELVTLLQDQRQQFDQQKKDLIANQQQVSSVTKTIQSALQSMQPTNKTPAVIKTAVNNMNQNIQHLNPIADVLKQAVTQTADVEKITTHMLSQIQEGIKDLNAYVSMAPDSFKAVQAIVQPLADQEAKAKKAVNATAAAVNSAATNAAASSAPAKIEQGLKNLGKAIGMGS